jgi:hypothetical protein
MVVCLFSHEHEPFTARKDVDTGRLKTRLPGEYLREGKNAVTDGSKMINKKLRFLQVTSHHTLLRDKK